MKEFLILRVFLFAAALSAGGFAEGEPLKNIRDHTGQFPRIVFAKDEKGQARISLLKPPEEPLQIQGVYYHGFRFTVPAGSNGSIYWMFLMPKPFAYREGEFSSSIMSVESGESIALPMIKLPVRPFELLSARFSKAEYFFQQQGPEKFLKPETEYLVLYRFSDPSIPEIQVALTDESNLGNTGFLPIGSPFVKIPRTIEAPLPVARELAKAVGAEFLKSGTQAGLRYLDRAYEDYMSKGGAFYGLYYAVWKEAQMGTGRTNPGWGAQLYDWLYLRSLSLNDETNAMGVTANLLPSMEADYRFGRLKEILGWYERALWRSGYDLDPASYPDLGPGIASLPEVRLRKIPLKAPLGFPYFSASGRASLYQQLGRLQVSAINAMASDRARSGRWREAFEWRFFVQAWAAKILEQSQDIEIIHVWYHGAGGNAGGLESLGLYEAAIEEYDKVVAHPWDDAYSNSSKLTAQLGKISCSILLGDYRPEMESQAREIAINSRKNIHVDKSFWLNADLIHARCLIASGKNEEGMAALESLIAQGHEVRWTPFFGQR